MFEVWFAMVFGEMPRRAAMVALPRGPAGQYRRGDAAGVVGRIVASEDPDFAVDDWVTGLFGVQEYVISDGRGVYPR